VHRVVPVFLSICSACAPAPGAPRAATHGDGGAVYADPDASPRTVTAAITGSEHDRSDCDGDTNDTPETATKLTAPLDAFICPLDDDWYRIDAPEGARVRIAFRHARGDLDLAAETLAGDALATSEGVHDEEVVVGRGRFVVRVYGYAGASNEYLISQHPLSAR
jgi:hypothetical protein